MKPSAISALVAVVALSAAVDAKEVICQDLITDPKVIDNGPPVVFWSLNNEFLEGAFYFNKTGSVYRLDFTLLNTLRRHHIRELTLVDDKCATLKLRYRQNPKDKTFKAESAELLLKQSAGNLVRDCSVRDPERYFSDGKPYGKQTIECYDDAGAEVNTLIVNKLRLDIEPFS